MAQSRGRDGWWPRMVGIRTGWRVTDDGEFFCPGCGGDRCYQRLAGRRRLTVLGVPVWPRGTTAPVVACAECHDHFPLTALEQPTSTRLAALLRDAVHSVALTLLTVGGGESRAARIAAVDTIRGAGYPDCTEERLLTLLAALSTESDAALELELRDTLAPLAPYLVAAGRENLLLHGARIALADGPYSDAERTMLTSVGGALGLRPSDTGRLLATATLS